MITSHGGGNYIPYNNRCPLNNKFILKIDYAVFKMLWHYIFEEYYCIFKNANKNRI